MVVFIEAKTSETFGGSHLLTLNEAIDFFPRFSPEILIMDKTCLDSAVIVGTTEPDSSSHPFLFLPLTFFFLFLCPTPTPPPHPSPPSPPVLLLSLFLSVAKEMVACNEYTHIVSALVHSNADFEGTSLLSTCFTQTVEKVIKKILLRLLLLLAYYC